MKKLLTAIIVVLSMTSCNKEQDPANLESRDSSTGNSTSVIYYNGDIITMEGEQPQYAEALVVKDGKILFTGKKSEAIKKAGAGHKLVDLKGKLWYRALLTDMPIFTDSEYRQSEQTFLLHRMETVTVKMKLFRQ